MRKPGVAVVIVIAMLGRVALAQQPPATNAEIDRLDQELRQLQSKNDPVAATKVSRKLYESQRKLSGDDSVYTWRRKVELISHLTQTGDYSEAIPLQKELIRAADNQHGADSREVHDAIGPLIGLYTMSRQLEEIEPLHLRLLAITKRLHGEDVNYATDLAGYAQYLSSRGENAAAQRAYEQAIKLEDAAHADVRGQLMMLGLLYLQTNQQPRAVVTWARYLDLAKSDPIDSRISTLWWVAERYHYAGRIDLATPITKQAVELAEQEVARIERAKGPNARELTSVLFSLGGMLHQSGDLTGAERVTSRHIALEEKLGGDPPYAQLGSIRRDQGRPREALALYEKATAQMAKYVKIGNTGLFPMQADILRELGDLRRAEQLYLTAQADLDKLFGKRAVLVLRLHFGLFAVYVAANQLDKAQAVLADNLEIAERELALVFATGTESDHVSYFNREAHQLDTAISFHAMLAPKSVSASRLALTTLLRRKGRVLDAAAANLATLRGKLSADDKKLLAQLDEARAKLAKLAVAGAQVTPDFAKQTSALEDQIRKLEVSLSERNAEYRVARQPIELATIQKAIPKDARLVEIVNYQPGDWKAPPVPKPAPRPRRYAAYILAERGDPTFVDLGPAAPIDDAVARFRGALANPDNDRVNELGRTLHDLTFGKLTRALGTSKHVLVAPDGALNLIPFAALFDGKQYLVKQYMFTYLTSGRDLLRFGVRSKAQGGAIIFADPDFDSSKPVGPTPPAGRRSRAMTGIHWPRLPGTGQEAEAVSKLLTGPKVYRELAATETALKAVHGPRVLHLATHGFFLADGSTDAAAENPLLRSGLAFAGANKLGTGSDDGVLTALEASGLDLWGTQLVVLSACETGVGTVTNGEGVYGLRRALVIAGAESLVMTLWQVDDLATRDLMTGYYERLQGGAGRSAALRDVQLEIQGIPKYAHPYYWASFVPAGDSSPLGK
ncbi:MAG: cellulose synthase subunit BcsC [Deltaproteobacteria bacterium]|nr:cellulose synthase subunit BcsC [Deltaproteobacteria bacterium]